MITADPSSLERDFLDFVRRNPKCLERSHFPLQNLNKLIYPSTMQSWPTFLEKESVDRSARTCIDLCQLILRETRRAFAGQPAALEEFYGLDQRLSSLMAQLLENRNYLEGLVARGDFILSTRGLQCIEINYSANVGGWQIPFWTDHFLAMPSIQRFIRESDLEIARRSPLRCLFSQVMRRAVERPSGRGEAELNVVLIRELGPRYSRMFEDYMDAELREVFSEIGGELEGSAFVCEYEELEERGGKIFLRGHRIHVIIEHLGGELDRRVLASWLDGAIDVYNGPLTYVLTDKRNLALLSELQGSSYLTADESALLEAHLPWTRRVSETYESFAGERVWLPEFLDARRSDLVLKSARGYGDEEVVVGGYASRPQWDSAVEAALDDGNWIVQQHVESEPREYQAGDRGSRPHDVIWGIFVIGDQHGGTWLRMMPKGTTGVINSTQGATEGLILEVVLDHS